MSGTSLDGVDAVLADHQDRVLAACHHSFSADFRQELLALNQPGSNELHRAALAANELARVYAQATVQLLERAKLSASDMTVLGAHGQTVRHQPGAHDGTGYTCQLLNGALLAELSGIDVVCDFRSRDVAAGGQGAPLVPAFHQARFSQPGVNLAVLNLGGMANLTLLPATGAVTGFDCGPGNVLIDQWCQLKRGMAFDASGAWARQGQVQTALLAQALTEPFYALRPPKSTGRELFDDQWIQRWLAAKDSASYIANYSEADIAATLTELTAYTVVQALRSQLPQVQRLVVCGGGAYNTTLLARLEAQLADQVGPGVLLCSSSELGIAPDQVEALAFAWLARAFIARRPGNLPAATGAKGPRVLGALHPAS